MSSGHRGAALFRVFLAVSIPLVVISAGVSCYLHFHSVPEAVKYSGCAAIGGAFLYFRLSRIKQFHGAVAQARQIRRAGQDRVAEDQ